MKFTLLAIAAFLFAVAPLTAKVTTSDQQACCGCCSTGTCDCAQCTCCDCSVCCDK